MRHADDFINVNRRPIDHTPLATGSCMHDVRVARKNLALVTSRRSRLIAMALGHDAANVPITHTFGQLVAAGHAARALRRRSGLGNGIVGVDCVGRHVACRLNEAAAFADTAVSRKCRRGMAGQSVHGASTGGWAGPIDVFPSRIMEAIELFEQAVKQRAGVLNVALRDAAGQRSVEFEKETAIRLDNRLGEPPIGIPSIGVVDRHGIVLRELDPKLHRTAPLAVAVVKLHVNSVILHLGQDVFLIIRGLSDRAGVARPL